MEDGFKETTILLSVLTILCLLICDGGKGLLFSGRRVVGRTRCVCTIQKDASFVRCHKIRQIVGFDGLYNIHNDLLLPFAPFVG